MNKKPRMDDELIQASDHISYEIWMMRECQERLCRTRMPPQDVVIYNALLNSFLSHVRSLLEFIYTEAKKANNDHVIAEDFFGEDPDFWRNNRPEKTLLLHQTHTRVQQAAVHLTYTRNKEQPRWAWIDIRQDLDSVLYTFVKLVPQHRIHPNLKELFKTVR